MGPAVARSPWVLGLGVDRWPPVHAFGRSEWAEAQLRACMVTRGRGQTQRASRGAL